MLLALSAQCQEVSDLRSVVTAPESAPEIVESSDDPIERALASMSLEQRIAQLTFVSFGSGHNPSSQERRTLKGFTPGGVLIPAVSSPENFEIFVRDLRLNPVEQRLRVPIFIATNFFALAGRQHTRLPYAPLPSPLALGASHDEVGMRDAAELISDYLDAFGIRLHFGPALALSVSVEGLKPSLNAFGETPEFGLMAARGFGEVFKERKIEWVPMEFPGGNGNRTPQSPAVLVTPRSVLLDRDAAPYRGAFEAGARFVHVGNTMVPTLESDAIPASVSYEVLTSLLRTDLGFDGIVIAGPMDDADLTRYYAGPDAPIRALMAGADMVWWNAPGTRAEHFIGRLYVAVQQGELPESLVDDKVRRILKVKFELGLMDIPLPRARDIQNIIKEQDKNLISSRLERQGIIFLKSTAGLLPISNDTSVPLGVTGVAGVRELFDVLEKEKIKPLGEYRIATARQGGQVFGFEIDRIMKGAEGTRVAVCILGAEIHGPTQREILRKFKEKGTSTITVMLGLPGDIDKYLELSDALIVILREPDDAMGPAMKALADVLLGRGPVRILDARRDLNVQPGEAVVFDIAGIAVTPSGRLPVTASELLPVGHGVGFSAPLEKRKVFWDFGDGTTATGPKVEHAYGRAGRYTATAWIQQDGSEIARGTFPIAVANTP